MDESAQSPTLSDNTGSSSDNTGTSSISSDFSRSSVLDKIVKDDWSTLDMECNIQAERITKCLDKLVYQTKLAVCIPTLLRENVLEEVLTREHFIEADFIIDQYEYPLASISIMNLSAIEDIDAGNVSLNNRVNPDLAYLMNTLYSYPELRPHVERLTETMKKDFEEARNAQKHVEIKTPKISLTEPPIPALKHLLEVEKFRDLMVQRMRTTAAEEIAAIIRTRQLEKSNNECLKKIAEDKKSLHEEKVDIEEQMRQKMELITQLKRQLIVNTQKESVRRKKQILNSERLMVLATRVHKVKFQMLKEEEVESREYYDNSVTRNMQTEKQLRDRRRKVETQLQSWLQKYDVEMQGKQEELGEITQQYDDEVLKIKELKLKLAEQDKKFYPLIAEKEGEYHQEMARKSDEFIVEHAARVIQYAWRTTVQNREEKKKLMKLKKKMEAEREAAARKAEIEAKKAALLAKKQAAKERAEAKATAKSAKLEAQANKGKEQKEDEQ